MAKLEEHIASCAIRNLSGFFLGSWHRGSEKYLCYGLTCAPPQFYVDALTPCVANVEVGVF